MDEVLCLLDDRQTPGVEGRVAGVVQVVGVEGLRRPTPRTWPTSPASWAPTPVRRQRCSCWTAGAPPCPPWSVWPGSSTSSAGPWSCPARRRGQPPPFAGAVEVDEEQARL